MGILLPLLVGIIYLGFYLHDRGFLQGAAHEAAVYVSLHADDKREISGAAQKLVAGRTLGAPQVSATVDAGERKVEILYEGRFLIPLLGGSLFGWSPPKVRAKVTLNVERPSRRIQKIRSAAKVINSMRRIRE